MAKKLTDLMAEVFGVEQSKITDDTTQNEVENWNSLNTLLLIDEIEKEYNVKLSLDDVTEITSVFDIKKILGKQNVNLD